MKYLFFSILYWNILFCFGQDDQFKNYIDGFGKSNLPILLNSNQTFNSIFNQRYDSIFKETYKEIPLSYVNKYICNEGFCKADPGYFRYDYGVSLSLFPDVITVIVRKQQYEGNDEYEFDLAEILVLNYTQDGMTISKRAITRDNDRWKSRVEILTDKIFVQQIKIIEPDINKSPDLSCEIKKIEFKITKNGNIELLKEELIKNGFVTWDKTIEDYILK